MLEALHRLRHDSDKRAIIARHPMELEDLRPFDDRRVAQDAGRPVAGEPHEGVNCPARCDRVDICAVAADEP